MLTFRIVLFSALFVLPEIAFAHSPIKGINNFYNGFLHPFFVPAEILAVLALGFLMGKQGLQNIKPVIFTFLGALIFGLIIAGFYPTVNVEVVLLLSTVVLGLVIAINPEMPTNVLLGFAVFTGVIIGLDSAQDTLFGKDRLFSLVGSGVSIYLLFLYAMVFAERFNKQHWQRIGLRVIGSWIAASAFLVLSLLLAANKG
jgi:hydrogenase/urease accessory protein HupE